METIFPPTKTDPEIKIKEMELQMLSKFLSSEKQKTQITTDERILISVLDSFASNPYPVSKNFCKSNNIPYDESEFTIDFMKEFLKSFLEYGIPLGRQGRNEEVKVISSYFVSQKNEDNERNNTITSKLMK